jgi:hypothetical protein
MSLPMKKTHPKMARRTAMMLEKFNQQESRYNQTKIKRRRELAEQKAEQKKAQAVFERVHAEIQKASRAQDQV